MRRPAETDGATGGTPGPEAVLPPSGEGTVLVDIGGDRGALVLYLPARLDGSEIEIRAHGAPWDGTHTGVRRRDLRNGSRVAAVFGSLACGGYQVRVRGGNGPVLSLAVPAGGVTEATWDEG